ncbi:MAG: DUF502 domain-containing protein [Planctomycetes bacterium]|nr:DUF502 domain-containing protein [Planctomycetota bacterium]
MDDFRRFFLRGLGALIPTLLTFAILVWAYSLVNDYVGVFVTKALLVLCSSVSAEPAPGFVNEETDPLRYGTVLNEWNARGERLTIEHKVIHHKALHHVNPDVRAGAERARNAALWQIAFAKYRLHLLGFLIAIILIYFIGFFLASFMGRAVWRAGERLLNRIPLIRAIYPHVKQVTDFLLSERKRFEVSGVVAVEYPRKGLWSLGLSTGKPLERVQDASSEELTTVFIPSSPTPITGYVIQVPVRDVVELNISIDEALRFTVSGGVIKPGAPLPWMAEGEDD